MGASVVFSNAFRDKSRGDFVFEKMRQAIQDGKYAQGERVREEEIAKSMGVSRTPVREALGKLQAHGFLEFASGRGLVIAQLDPHQVAELYAMRELLEGAGARWAAQYATPSEIVHLREILSELATTMSNPARSKELNRMFHRDICLAAHNRYMLQSLNTLNYGLALIPGTTFSLAGRAQSAHREHIKLVDAIEKRDQDLAERLAREHIREAGRLRVKMMFSESARIARL